MRTERQVYLLETKDYGWEIVDPIHPDLIPEPFEEEVLKHGSHEQKTHGSWANGELSDEQKSVVSAWTSLSNKTSWRQIANDLSEGKTPSASDNDIKTVKTLVDAIKQNGVIPAEALGRAELLTTGLRWQGALPKVGDSLKNELSSATLDERTSERFSQYSDFGGSKGKPVIFHYGFQTKGLDVNRAGADTFADEQEWLVSGTFKVTDKYSENGITHLNLKPIDSVEKHGSHDQKRHGRWATGVTDIVEWNKAEMDKFPSREAREAYLLDHILSQRMEGFTGQEFHRAVDAYQTAHGYRINEALRDPQISEDGVQEWIDGMDRAIASAPLTKEEMTVYRGIKGNGLDFFEGLKKGDVYTDKGFTSTTLDTDVATIFSTNSMYQGIVLRMKLPAGTEGLYPTSVLGLSSISSREAEFVLPRDSKFKVLNNEGKVWDVEVVDD